MEYEYSFNVKSIDPYIEYCKKNNYINISTKKENRIVYHNDNLNHIIARITITQDKTILDFKKVTKEKNNLKESLESLPLDVSDINIAKSMLDTLGFYEKANNTRIRYIYIKDDVIFEIDDYINPKMCVIAIEGNKEKVDKVYSEIKEYER